jgi:hypothetical protein
MTAALDEDGLRKALAAQGFALRDEDVAATLATARFLLDAARRVREVAR